MVLTHGDLGCAPLLLGSGITTLREAGYPWAIVDGLNALGAVALRQGDTLQAARVLAEALVEVQAVRAPDRSWRWGLVSLALP